MDKINIRHLGEMSPHAFCKAIEKKIRKEVRVQFPFAKGEKILVIHDKTANGFVTIEILRSVLQTMPVKIEVREQESCFATNEDFERYDKVVVPWNADDELQNFLGELFEKKEDDSPRGIKLLQCLLRSEVYAYAKIKGFDVEEQSKDQWSEIEEKYPGGKFALLKSSKLLRGH